MNSTLRHQGKVALVSGAARGMGREIAVRLAEEGCDLAIFDLCAPVATTQYEGTTPTQLDDTSELVRSLGRRCLAQIIDVRDYDRVRSFVEDAATDLGSIDIACPNVGFITWVPFLELTNDQWDDVIDITLNGAFNTLQPAGRQMAAQGSGSIVVVSSVNAIEPVATISHYTSAKHGVAGLAKSMALELADFGVRVNSVLPGAVNTPMANNPTAHRSLFHGSDATEEAYLTASRQWHALRDTAAIPPSSIAGVVPWLCSDEAAYLTGAEVVVDAGHLLLPGMNPKAVTHQ